MKLTKREVWALHTMLDRHIARYLMANTKGREDGNEKGEEHWEISRVLGGFAIADGSERNAKAASMGIHDYLADILTDRMDEVIFFPTDKPLVGTDYDQFRTAFFDVLIKNMDGIVKAGKESLEDLS